MIEQMNRKCLMSSPTAKRCRGWLARRLATGGALSLMGPWLLLATATGCAPLKPANPGHELELRFVNAGEDEPAIEPVSGWPLTLSLTANEKKLLGIGIEYAETGFPANGDPGYLVFEDPDGCPSWVPVSFQEGQVIDQTYLDCVELPPPVPWPMDETRIEFRPGLLRRDLSECGDRPEILVFDDRSATKTSLMPIGPCVGSESDEFGYGPNPRLPGLVVLADTGPGVVTDEHFNRPSPVAATNLAGLFESVAYELKDFRGRTSIFVHMSVPAGLFSPVILADQSVGDRCGALVRVDGGPEVCRTNQVTDADFNRHVVTLRAFVVNGRAPAAFADLDGNGLVDSADAEPAGFHPLSNQAAVRFTQVHVPRHPFWFDFDGDGQTGGKPPFPGGPGGVVPPPR